MTQAAILIQSKFRSYHEQKKFQQSRRAAVLIQQYYRSYKEFGRLKPHHRGAAAALVQHKLRYGNVKSCTPPCGRQGGQPLMLLSPWHLPEGVCSPKGRIRPPGRSWGSCVAAVTGRAPSPAPALTLEFQSSWANHKPEKTPYFIIQSMPMKMSPSSPESPPPHLLSHSVAPPVIAPPPQCLLCANSCLVLFCCLCQAPWWTIDCSSGWVQPQHLSLFLSPFLHPVSRMPLPVPPNSSMMQRSPPEVWALSLFPLLCSSSALFLSSLFLLFSITVAWCLLAWWLPTGATGGLRSSDLEQNLKLTKRCWMTMFLQHLTGTSAILFISCLSLFFFFWSVLFVPSWSL